MGIVTDSITMEIQIVQHGIAQLIDPLVPSEVEANTPFEITYSCKNNGPVDDSLYGHVLDVDKNELDGSRWDEIIPAGETVSKIYAHMGIGAPTSITIEVGHN